MEKMKVKDIMIAADQFPKISENASFYEAVFELERVQKRYLSGESAQRILLVKNEAGKITGKLSPIDLFRGLETNYDRVDVEESLRRFGLQYVWKSMQDDYSLWENPFKDLCRKTANVKIRDFINTPPSKGQCVAPDDALAKCFHLFVMNRHDALFVVHRDEIIGLLRFSDVYRRASQTMKECA